MMVKMFVNDPFSNYIYQKHLEALMARFKKEKRFPCYSVGKLIYACNRRNYYGIKDMFDGVEKDYDREGIVRMTLGTIMHDEFELSDKAEWHLVYEEVYGHVDEYFSDTKILIEKKTTMEEIPYWKQKVVKGGGRFMYMPGEEWENQLRYYYLLIQKGTEVETGNLANPNKEKMVRRVYVLYYSMNIDDMLYPYIIPVPMISDKWNLEYIEEEMLGKKDEIENCIANDTIPDRNMSPSKCPYCPYMLRCFHKDKEDDDEDVPEEIRLALGKRSKLAKAQELKA
jgi:hypothetical protein